MLLYLNGCGKPEGAKDNGYAIFIPLNYHKMKKTQKRLYTLICVIVFMLFNGIIQTNTGPGGKNPGGIGVILLLALIIGLVAIWKSEEPKKTE
jgi:hypothetical protein